GAGRTARCRARRRSAAGPEPAGRSSAPLRLGERRPGAGRGGAAAGRPAAGRPVGGAGGCRRGGGPGRLLGEGVPVHVAAESGEREDLTVEVVVDGEVPGEAGAGEVRLVPGAVLALGGGQ